MPPPLHLSSKALAMHVWQPMSVLICMHFSVGRSHLRMAAESGAAGGLYPDLDCNMLFSMYGCADRACLAGW